MECELVRLLPVQQEFLLGDASLSTVPHTSVGGAGLQCGWVLYRTSSLSVLLAPKRFLPLVKVQDRVGDRAFDSEPNPFRNSTHAMEIVRFPAARHQLWTAIPKLGTRTNFARLHARRRNLWDER